MSIPLTIEVVTASNDHTEAAGFQTDALAAIVYTGEHQGVHFLVAGSDEAARALLLYLIAHSGFPYVITE